MKPIKVGIVVDCTGGWDTTPEQEIEEIMEFLIVGAKLPVWLAASGEHVGVVEGKSVDLLIIDYGGLMPGAYGVQVSQIEQACEWAKEHPGKIMIIWSSHTREIYIDELESVFGNLGNVRFRFKSRFGSDLHTEMFDELKTWYGIGEQDGNENLEIPV